MLAVVTASAQQVVDKPRLGAAGWVGEKVPSLGRGRVRVSHPFPRVRSVLLPPVDVRRSMTACQTIRYLRITHPREGNDQQAWRYFLQRWDNLQIPEYDFDTGELVYRGHNGNELRREPFENGKCSEDFRQRRGTGSDVLPISA